MDNPRTDWDEKAGLLRAGTRAELVSARTALVEVSLLKQVKGVGTRNSQKALRAVA